MNIYLALVALSLPLTCALMGCKSKSVAVSKNLASCTAEDIRLAINHDNHKFPKQMDGCASSSWGNAEKTSQCLKTHYASLSYACAKCFGEMASCSTDHCKWKCIGEHFSKGCLSCINSNCLDSQKHASFSLTACTGLKPSELPPSK